MKNDREIADHILDLALSGKVENANALLENVVVSKSRSRFRVHGLPYLIVLFSLTLLCLGIDALDGDIIDHL